MKLLTDQAEKEAKAYIEIAAKTAKKATCARAKCGSIIVKSNKIIGEGFNSPPLNLESQRRCSNSKNNYNSKITDKTCCIHAEQRAIMDAIQHNPNELTESTLYFIRLDEQNQISKAGEPYCTICSKMALDSGVKEFVLWHKKGIHVYNTQEYNDLSFKYQN